MEIREKMYNKPYHKQRYFFCREGEILMRIGKWNVFSVMLFAFVGLWLGFMDKAFSDQIKTIDDRVVEGKVVHVYGEYLSLRQENGGICFIQWRTISLITKDEKVIVVNHGEKKTSFSVLTTAAGALSAQDLNLTITDNVSDIYPGLASKSRPLFKEKTEHPAQFAKGETVKPLVVDSRGESQRDASVPEKSWKGNVDAGLTVKKGNTEATTTTIKTEFSREKQRDHFYLTGLFLLETENGSKNTDEQRGTGKYERKHTEKAYSFYQESLERDEIERISIRSISSTGMGYRFLAKGAFRYKSEIGPSYMYEKFQHDVTETSIGLRLGSYLNWQILPSTKYYFKMDYLPGLQDFAQWRIESDMGLRQSINKSLSLTVSWIDEFDNNPGVDGVRKNDATILSAIGYEF